MKPMKPMNPFSKTMLKGETKAMDKKAMAAGKKAYKASEMKSMAKPKKMAKY